MPYHILIRLTLYLMWIQILQVKVLIITLSLYRKRANHIHIIKEHFHWQSRVQALSKTPIKITEAVYTVKLISYLHIRTHVCTLLFQRREFARKRYSVSEHFNDDSSEHFWLVVEFISSPESCVIGYNAQTCLPASELNVLITLVWLY